MTTPGAILGDTAYAQVNSKALPGYYKEFRAELHRKGVVKWERSQDASFKGWPDANNIIRHIASYGLPSPTKETK